MSQPPPTPKRHRWATCLGCLGVLALAVLLLVLPIAMQFRPFQRIRISHETTRITAPVSEEGSVDYFAYLNEQNSRGVTPEENAAVDYLRILPWVSGYYPPTVREKEEIASLLGTNPFDGTAAQFHPWEPTEDQEVPNPFDVERIIPWDELEFPAWAEWLDEQAPALEIAERASHKPKFYSPLVWPESGSIASPEHQHIHYAQILARAWKLRAMKRLHDGEIEGSLSDIACMRRLARQVATSPTHICIRCGHAIELSALDALQTVVTSDKLDAAQLQTVVTQALDSGPIGDLQKTMDTGQRFIVLAEVQRLARGEITLSELTMLEGEPEGSMFNTFTWSFDWNSVLMKINSIFDQYTEALGETNFQARNAAIEAIDDEVSNTAFSATDPNSTFRSRKSRSESLGSVFLELLSVGVSGSAIDGDRILMRQNLVALAAMLQEYKLNEGTFPSRLEELGPKAVELAAVDRFNLGNPLTYLQEGEGFILYSFGENELDDGGCEHSSHDMSQADDLVVRYPPNENKSRR